MAIKPGCQRRTLKIRRNWVAAERKIYSGAECEVLRHATQPAELDFTFGDGLTMSTVHDTGRWANNVESNRYAVHDGQMDGGRTRPNVD